MGAGDDYEGNTIGKAILEDRVSGRKFNGIPILKTDKTIDKTTIESFVKYLEFMVAA
jgi:hypothetical protein